MKEKKFTKFGILFHGIGKDRFGIGLSIAFERWDSDYELYLLISFGFYQLAIGKFLV